MDSMMPYPDMLILPPQKNCFQRPPTGMTWESNRYTGYPKHGHSNIEKNEDRTCEWISLMENLQETIEFPLTYGVFL